MTTDGLFAKENFPLLNKNPDLAYFDNASSTQIHQSVLDSMNDYYVNYRANPGRGSYPLSIKAGNAINIAKEQVAEFMKVDTSQILFTTGATQGLNWVANWCSTTPNVFITDMEHNSNLIPWLSQRRQQGKGLEVISIDPDGNVDYNVAKAAFSRHNGGVLSISVTSNLTGININWKLLVTLAKTYNMAVCLDMCQGFTCFLDNDEEAFKLVDFATFSGHKMYGPNGVGVLYAKDANTLPPMYGGGGMVTHANYEGYTLADVYEKHQAGTANVAGIIGMGVSCELLSYYGTAYHDDIDEITDHLKQLGLFDIPEIQLLGKQKASGNIYSFNSKFFDMSDMATMLADANIAVRCGQMCAYPYAQKINGDNCILRISTSPYNTYEDCKKLVTQIKKSVNRLT